MSSSESKQSKVNYFLPIITCIVAIAVSYGTLDAQVTELEKRVSTLEERTLVQLESLNDGMNNLRVEVAKVSNDLEWLKKEMSEK
jgi:uncharacterized coiled-coil protein SlyX